MVKNCEKLEIPIGHPLFRHWQIVLGHSNILGADDRYRRDQITQQRRAKVNIFVHL